MKRETSIVMMIEPAFKDKLIEVAEKAGKTVSAYMRDLAINDLRDKEAIDNEFILRVLLNELEKESA